MNKKIFIIGASALLLCGCGKVPKLSNGDEAVITFKGGEKISANEFYNSIKDKFGLETLVGMIDKYVYEKEFSDKTKDAKEYAEASIKSLRQSYKTDEELLSALKMYGMNYQTVEAYQEALYINYLQNEAIETYVKGKITEDELKKYYENDVYPNMTISHILITPKTTDSAKTEEKEKAEKEAKEKVESIIKELEKAKKDGVNITEEFARLAKENSEDDSTKDKGGDLGEINLGSLSNKYDELVKAAGKLKDGEFSTEVITTESGYHVILKTKTGEKKSYDDSLDNMKDKIMQNKLASKDGQTLMVDAIKHYREIYELNIVDSEISTQYGRYMNNLINNAKNSANSEN